MAEEWDDERVVDRQSHAREDRVPVTDPVDPDDDRSLPSSFDFEFGPAVVGLLVGAGGLLFLVDPLVGAVALGPVRARPVALSTVALGAGFCLGAGVFYRRGHRLFAAAHAVFGLAWLGVAVGTALGNGVVVVGAVLLVVAGAGWLVTRTRAW
ncbi:hypothetical protein [Haloplanus rubicundus]|uniref:hypothetical protein n=1 Tax=Haloplanus rubicundus TaxID=1547898 RepID=UPI001C9E401D|nr:hypothetical protein [Haloplanus rubicundus]